MDKRIMDDFVWVKRGSQRSAILKVMDNPKFPSEITKDAHQYNKKISLNNCSDVLRSFAERNIAKCLNSKEKIGRLYELTNLGKNIRKEIV